MGNARRAGRTISSDDKIAQLVVPADTPIFAYIRKRVHNTFPVRRSRLKRQARNASTDASIRVLSVTQSIKERPPTKDPALCAPSCPCCGWPLLTARRDPHTTSVARRDTIPVQRRITYASRREPSPQNRQPPPILLLLPLALSDAAIYQHSEI